MKLPDKVYDILKWVTMLVLPALWEICLQRAG